MNEKEFIEQERKKLSKPYLKKLPVSYLTQIMKHRKIRGYTKAKKKEEKVTLILKDVKERGVVLKWKLDYWREVERGKRLLIKVVRCFFPKAKYSDITSEMPSSEKDLENENYTMVEYEEDRVQIFMWINPEEFGLIDIAFDSQDREKEERIEGLARKLERKYKTTIDKARKIPGVKKIDLQEHCCGDYYGIGDPA
jgi:hypothetical protein